MSMNDLINANIHRIKEGARVLEEVARFILRDGPLFKKIRTFRHALQATPPILSEVHDLGGVSLQEENTRHNLLALVQANAIRIQEALRVLEEISTDQTHKQKMKSLRYTAYELQAVLYQRTQQFVRQDKLCGLYLIIDTDLIKLPLEEILHVINQSTVNLVQLRSHSLSKRALLQQAITCKTLLHADKLLIIHDHLDMALDVAEGIHLGQADYPIDRIKKLLPDNFLLGVTCPDLKTATFAAKHGASYLSIGNLFAKPDETKAHDTSLTKLQEIQATVHLPICAMGGIHAENLQTILACHVQMVAAISAIWQQEDPLAAIQALQKQLG